MSNFSYKKYEHYKNKNILQQALVYFFFLIIVVSCTPEERNYPLHSNSYQHSMQVNTKGSIVLGDKLNDPYKLDNMNNAFLELAASGIQFPFSSVSPTGKYVRVLIHTDEELEQLESDTSIIWFEYPLDYAIAELGCSYYDPTLSDSTYSWQYGVAPIEYTFPENLYVEQIYSVFIPEDYPEYSSYSNILDLLEDVSDSKCNSENMQVAHSLTKSSKWNPSAQVEVWDDEEDGYVPLDGVRVIARKCTKSRYAITDELGQCTINTKFKGNVDYSIEWRRHYWRIVKGQYNKKTYLIGPTTNSSWNLSIAKSSESDYMRATIHRAAIVANYKDIWTIKRPRKSNFLGCIIKLKIRYENSNNGDVTGSTQNGSNNLNGADVVIWGKNQNNELYLTQDVFSTTIHELAHFSHRLFYNKNNPSGNFDQDVNQFILESWARCVQWKVTTDYYQSPWGPIGYKYGFQDWNLFMANSTTGAYTPVFIDLIDDFNQHNSNTSYCNDNISGYTMKEIQDSLLPSTYNLSTLSNALLNHLAHGTTTDQVNDLLSDYFTITFF